MKNLKLSKKKVYYLASPYTHDESFVRELRYMAVNFAAAELIKKGYQLFEPIASCHYKSRTVDLPSGYAYWKKRDRKYIEKSDGLIVLTIQGWRESIGVKDEIKHAEKLKLPVHYLSLDDMFPQEVIHALHNS